MGVYIKGMAMPTSCSDCKLRMPVGCCGNLPHNARMPNCPLIHVPPHGRSIDADALKIEVFAHDKLMKDGWNNMDMGMFTGNLMEVIDSAPTIIEAEEGE